MRSNARILCPVLLLATALLAGCDPGRSDVARPPPEPLATLEVAVDAAPARMLRLTATQYRRAVGDIFGPDIVIATPLAPDLRQEGFLAVGAGRASISARGVELYEDAAFAIAEQAVAPGRRGGWCTPEQGWDADCARAILGPLARLVWRRPVTAVEVDGLLTIGLQAYDEIGDFYDALVFPIARLLQSPEFLFRVEVGQGGRLTDLELASRLAFFLWNTTPDDALLTAAEGGALATEAGLTAEIDRMLLDSRARVGVRAFFDENFGLDGLQHLSKDPMAYAHASPELGPAAREETLRTIERAFGEHLDYRTLFTSRETFVNRRLAALYDIPAPIEAGYSRVTLPADGTRAGLLGHASLLNLYAHATGSSATLRGQFVRRAILCGVIPPPPGDVDTSLPESNADAPTLRDRLTTHRENPACASCHDQMDPLGLALERFDGVGRFRVTEGGAPIDPSGEVDGIPFGDARGLGEAVAAHPDLASCLTRRMYRYATGHLETTGEDALLEVLTARFARRGHAIAGLMRDIALSPGFRQIGPPAEAEEAEQ